jgi:hypothetical protein
VTITKVSKEECEGEFDSAFKGPGAPPKPGDIAEPRGW